MTYNTSSLTTEVAPGYNKQERVKKFLEHLFNSTALRGNRCSAATQRARKPTVCYPEFLYDI